jgi:hypothetical protein
MKYLQISVSLSILSIAFSSCEKVIDLDLPDGEKLIYLDAWITDKPGVQSIKLLQAVNYMDQNQPSPVTDATIRLTDLTINKTYDFNYSNGSYSFDPGPSQSIGISGHKYKLDMTCKGEKFEATDLLPRVAKIDSLTLEHKENKNDYEKEGYYAELYARDLAGAVDYYWIRTFRNAKLNPYLDDMLSIDGSFYAGVSDGFVFIPPFREGVTSGEHPYQKGDEVQVVLRTVSKDSYLFMEQAMEQIANEGMFAEVLQNVPSNIFNLKTDGGLKMYGWFGTVAEISAARKVE